MKQLLWCAVAGKGKVLQVDIAGCDVVYDLQKAVAYKTRYKVPFTCIQIWKLHSPSQWPAQDGVPTKDFPTLKDALNGIATRLFPYESLEGQFNASYLHGSDISIVVKVITKRKVIPLLPYPTRRVWCAIAGEGRILQVDIPLSNKIDDVRKAIAKEMSIKSRRVGKIWKVKDPHEWSISEAHKKLHFPQGDTELERIAQLLKQPLDEDVFDDVIRYYYVYLIITIEKEEGEPSTACPEQLIWCVTDGEKRTFQVDVAGCATIGEVLDAAVAKAGFLINPDLKELLRVRVPQNWPITEETRILQTIRESGLSSVSDMMLSLERINETLNMKQLVNMDNIGLILTVAPEGPTKPIQIEDRFAWCVVGQHNYLARINLKERYRRSIMPIVKQQTGYVDMKDLTLWMIERPSEYPIRDIFTGTKAIPNDTSDLQQIAQEVDHSMGVKCHAGEFVSYFLQIPKRSDSRTVSEPRLRPFEERNDVQRSLLEMGFDDENILVNSSRPHVAQVFSIDGNDKYFAKYLTSNRRSEINVLKYLSKFKAPHVPSRIKSRKLEEGSLLLVPYLGEPVTDYEHLERDLLSIIRQFLEGVAFLHSKFVAHLDLKPSHIVVNKEGVATIIDYDLSMRFKDMSKVTSGVQGTKGYMAPEVGEEEYNPFLADIWSAGCVVEDLCYYRLEGEDAEFFHDLSERMMDDNPLMRLSVQDAAQEVAKYIAKSSGE